jgi:hypothetical protein
MSKENVGLACVGLIVLTLGAIIVGTIINGWAISVLWGWFIVPVFSVPSLTVPYAAGLSLVASMLSSSSTINSSETKGWTEVISSLVGRIIIAPILTVLVGWVLLQLIH